ncbi:MAG: 50S ribosomal protein L6 [bacterium]
MSRIGKQIINIPEKTEVIFNDFLLTVKGPKGTLSREIRPGFDIKVENGTATVIPLKHDLQARALWGTYGSHLKNMVIGVTEQFTKKLLLEGIGYKAEVVGNQINLNLGFSHPIHVAIPEGVTVTTEKGQVIFSGCDKEAVFQLASQVRALKKPEPYKGKGFRYEGEVIKRKQGKKAA